MGKAGKAKKRQRQDNEHKRNVVNLKSIDNVVVNANVDIDSDSDSDCDDGFVDETNIDSKVCEAIKVIEILSNRNDIYMSKTFKMLRTTLFPLIKIQTNKFFETAGIEVNPSILSTDNIKKVLCLRNITTTVEVIQYFVNNIEQFNTTEHKSFRKCMHPLVLYQIEECYCCNKWYN